jgi:hypothetical protein
MRYLVVVEATSTGFSAYSPDLPGCVATATTREDVEAEMAYRGQEILDVSVRRNRLFGQLLQHRGDSLRGCRARAQQTPRAAKVAPRQPDLEHGSGPRPSRYASSSSRLT